MTCLRALTAVKPHQGVSSQRQGRKLSACDQRNTAARINRNTGGPHASASGTSSNFQN